MAVLGALVVIIIKKITIGIIGIVGMAGIAGKEGEVLKKAFPYCILLIISVGIETLLFAFFE